MLRMPVYVKFDVKAALLRSVSYNSLLIMGALNYRISVNELNKQAKHGGIDTTPGYIRRYREDGNTR